MDKVMVFIDLRNMLKSVETMEPELFKLDFGLLTRILVGNRELVAAYIFDTKMPYGMDDASKRLHDSLSYQGFRVMTRESYNPLRKEQKEVDVAMACEMLAHALRDHYDVAIVASGDGDFVPAVQQVQAAGKMVEVAAFTNTLNGRLRRFADTFYELEGLPILRIDNYPNERSLEVAAKSENKEHTEENPPELKTQTDEAVTAVSETAQEQTGENPEQAGSEKEATE